MSKQPEVRLPNVSVNKLLQNLPLTLFTVVAAPLTLWGLSALLAAAFGSGLFGVIASVVLIASYVMNVKVAQTLDGSLPLVLHGLMGVLLTMLFGLVGVLVSMIYGMSIHTTTPFIAAPWLIAYIFTSLSAWWYAFNWGKKLFPNH